MSNKRIYPSASGDSAAPVPERLTKIKAAAAARGFEEEYVRRLVESRRIRSWKVGKYRMIQLKDLDAYIASGYTPADGVTA